MFNFRNKRKSSAYEEDIMDLATKEEEILSSYKDEEAEEIEEYVMEEEYEFPQEREEEMETVEEQEEDSEEYHDFLEESVYSSEVKTRKIKKIMNILFAIIMIVLTMIAIDVICVARYNIGPFFAIPVKTYKDGGTKEYYGIGYKVIKYNQIQGRRDREIGFWSLKYNTEPITIQDVDLAIEVTGNEQAAYEKYYKKFVRIISTLQKVDLEKNQITIGYYDEDQKYSLEMICDIVPDQTNIATFELDQEITVIGTITDLKGKTSKRANQFYIENCFAEQ